MTTEATESVERLAYSIEGKRRRSTAFRIATWRRRFIAANWRRSASARAGGCRGTPCCSSSRTARKPRGPAKGASMTTENKPRRPSMICLADVEPEDIGWLWPDRIPLGKLTVMSSDPGCGKSTVTMDMAARVSTGRAWPLVFGGVAPIGSVLFLSAEDGLADTIRPRLDAAGADVAKVHALDVQSIANHGLQGAGAKHRGHRRCSAGRD